MATIGTELSMSLDGFIADSKDEVGPLFDWYGSGDVEVEFPNGQMTAKVSQASAEHLRSLFDEVGALITGRRLFDLTKGWDGSHPIGVPVVVLSHSIPDGWPRDDAPFTFVTDGLESAVARAEELAGDKMVSVGGPNVIQQCLNAGLMNELVIDLVPVLLVEGIPYFANLSDGTTMLDGPTKVIEGDRVTHLYYTVRKT